MRDLRSILDLRAAHTLANTYFRQMAAMIDSPVTPTLESNHTSPTVLHDPAKVGVAVGISLISYTQAEIYDVANVLPVNGGHD